MRTILLNDGWKLKGFEIGKDNEAELASPKMLDRFWMTALVPGDVHSTLIKHKLIPDPFVGHNDQQCQWIEDRVWWYRKKFNFREKIAADEKVELIFDGLDTFAVVYLNGLKIGSTANMFMEHSFDITADLKQGENTLAVKFEPVSQHTVHNINMWGNYGKERPWARKAQMNFGWDWGPRLVTAGIWQDVRLKKYKQAKLESVQAQTVELSRETAQIKIDLEIDNFNKSEQLAAIIKLNNQTTELEFKQEITASRESVTFTVEDPELWWTNDLGPANLYQLEVELMAAGIVVDTYQSEFGIRTLEVEMVNQTGENVFTFILNGIPIFAKGANWIPVDNFFAAADNSRYVSLVELAAEAGMNMLRVWGGGIYEKDIFYQECNRQGILVWQDFMFACAVYPDYNKDFMANVAREIEFVVKRLRNHPCLAIWCGNNENHWIHEKKYTMGEIDYRFYGEKIYDQLMPELLAELDPGRLYWPSSPYGGNDHNDPNLGDQHNWQVWHGLIEPRKFGEEVKEDFSVEGVSFKNFKKDQANFVSEFGMHASANKYTLSKNIPAGEYYWGSTEMNYRNKDVHHEKGILLMEGYTGRPNNIVEYLNYSMLTQAEGLKYGIEHYRRRRPRTSGSLFWQLNDSWPGTSWSVIDYYLLPKAGYYYAKKFFAPILISLNYDPGNPLEIWVTNDLAEAYQDQLQFQLFDFAGQELYQITLQIEVAPTASKLITSLNLADILPAGVTAAEVVVKLSAQQQGVPANLYYLVDNKDLRLPEADLSYQIAAEQKIILKAKTQIRFVKLEIPQKEVVFSDNFFDLTAGETKEVTVRHLQNKEVKLDKLEVSSLN